MGKVQYQFHQLVDMHYPISGVTNDGAEAKEKKSGQQVFRNLIVHRRVINHPMLAAESL